ncbi:protein O-mannosyl-transferase TMTC1 [Patella vulgata]|uniref:protein O-mannosyl-transferase TMTC1 n=1 Tax=Patella vulgata TaxID=6465 RepID=UPI0021809564|nr:protein O-mannosyl-transferase TMTC1 [Patella vulgata]
MTMEVNNNIVKGVREIKSRPKTPFQWLNRGTLYAIPVLLAAICYYNSLNGEFVHDDIFAIKKNPDVNGKAPASGFWWNDFWGKRIHLNNSHKSYRPLTTLSFRINYELSGGRAYWFHVVNVILHCITTGLFTYLLHDVFNISTTACFFTSLLFAVHPIHTEAVSGIVGRADILAAIFVLVSLILYMRVTETDDDYADDDCDFPVTKQPLYLAGSIMSAVVAMLCKEHGIMVLVIMAAVDCLVICRKGVNRIISSPRSFKQAGQLASRILIISFSFLTLIYLRFMINGGLPKFIEQDNPASFSSSLLTRILTYNYLLAFNSWLLLAPIKLCYDWQIGSIPLVESVDDIRNISTITFYVFLVFILVKCYFTFRSQKSVQNIPLIAALLIILPFIPASNAFIRVGFVVAERILYIPSLGFCLLVGHGLSCVIKKFPGKKSVFVSMCVAYAIVLSLRTVHRNQVWLSRQSLFISGVVTLPHNAKVHYNYGNYLKDIGNISEAIYHYQESVRLYPPQPSVHNNLGTILTNQSWATYHFREALRYNPQHKGALVNLGNIYLQRKDRAAAERLVKQALRIDPDYLEGLLSLSKIMMELKRNEEAKFYIEKAVKAHPNSADVHNFNGAYLHYKGRYEESVSSFQRAYALDSRTPLYLIKAVSGLQILGEVNEAETQLNRALNKKPSVEVMDQLGLLYYKTQRLPESLTIYRNILKQAPNSTEAATHYARILYSENETDEAESISLNVLNHDPNNLPCLQLMVAISASKKQLNKAIEYSHLALDLADGNEMLMLEMNFQLGNIYREVNDLKNSLKCFEKCIKINSNYVMGYLHAGGIHHLQKNFSKAKENYNKALKIDPNNEMAKENLAKLKRQELKANNASRKT